MKTSGFIFFFIISLFSVPTQLQAQFLTPLSTISGPAEVTTIDGWFSKNGSYS